MVHNTNTNTETWTGPRMDTADPNACTVALVPTLQRADPRTAQLTLKVDGTLITHSRADADGSNSCTETVDPDTAGPLLAQTLTQPC